MIQERDICRTVYSRSLGVKHVGALRRLDQHTWLCRAIVDKEVKEFRLYEGELIPILRLKPKDN